MATDVERLIVSLEARTAAFEKALNRANGVANRSARSIETRFARMNRNLSSGIGAFAKGFAGAFAAGFSVREVGQLIETSQRIENSLKTTGLAGEELKRVYEQLFAVAQKNAAPVESLVTLYSRLSAAQKELGVSQEELIGFTDTVAKALKVEGKSAQEASGALLQLSQALGGGIVQAEEYNSLIDGARPLLQAAAAGLKEAGGSVAQLTRLVKDGKVSSEAFFRAIEAGSPILDQRLVGAETTVSQSFVRLQNVLVDAAGRFNESTKAAETFGKGIEAAADFVNSINFDHLISEVQRINAELNAGISAWQNYAREAGRALGLDRVGEGIVRGGQSVFGGEGASFGPFSSTRIIQDRIDGAFGNAVENAGALTEKAIQDAARRYGVPTTGGKTGRLPAAAPVVNPISLSDYETGSATGAAAKKAATEAKKAADRLTDAISRQSSIAVDAATQYLGQNETANRGNINAFLRAGGVDLDAATTAWCAAFVNSALAQVGVTGSGSNVATDFLNWGAKVDPSQVQRGDVLVDPNGRGAGQLGGHVGFATGQVRFEQGILQLQMLSGNASNQVQEDWVNASEVVARRATDAVQVSADALGHITEQSKAALQAQTDALKQQEQAYQQLGQIGQTALNGLSTALADGKIEGEELLQILFQIVQQLLSMPGGLGGIGGLLGGGGGGGGLLGGLLIPGILHKGGVAGVDGYGHGRAVSPRAFAGARRYHKGGVAGLQPGEVPAILQRGEVVIPRGGGGGQQQGIAITVGVSADNNGNLMPFVESVSQQQAAKVTQQGIGAYDKQLNRTIGGKLANAQARQL